MIKKLIWPMQKWLLNRGQCVGCGRPLKNGARSPNKVGQTKVTCKCGRIFIEENAKYRRALFAEV